MPCEDSPYSVWYWYTCSNITAFLISVHLRQPNLLSLFLDEWIGWLTRNVLMGRFINIFAFLFGMSFFHTNGSCCEKRSGFQTAFYLASGNTLLIGVVGSAFYSGDILSFYALFGLVLVLLYPLKTRVLVVVASLILIGAPRWISFGYDKIAAPRNYRSCQCPRNGTRACRASAPNGRRRTRNSVTCQYHQKQLMDGRMRTLNYQFNWGGRGYLTFALFILGLVVGRIRFFETVHLHTRRNISLFVSFAAGAWIIGRMNGLLPQEHTSFMQGITPSATALFPHDVERCEYGSFSAITMGFVILYHMKGIGKCLNLLTPYGRMGLTNYEAQGIIGSIIFSLWGFGSIFGRWHATELFCLGIAFYIVQVVFSRIWLTYFKYGPLEWFWRSATYLKWQPFRK